MNHPCIVAHGCSHEYAIEHAIDAAHRAVREGIVTRFNAQLTLMLRRHQDVASQVVSVDIYDERVEL